jgi:hydrogenase expression/formation protein HypC
MCLGIPGQVVEMTDPDAYLAKVDVSGIKRAISVRLLADSGIDIGDWVLVHVGFAMAKIDEREAHRDPRRRQADGQGVHRRAGRLPLNRSRLADDAKARVRSDKWGLNFQDHR